MYYRRSSVRLRYRKREPLRLPSSNLTFIRTQEAMAALPLTSALSTPQSAEGRPVSSSPSDQQLGMPRKNGKYLNLKGRLIFLW